MIKYMTQRENITIINEYDPKNRASKHMKQKIDRFRRKNRQLHNHS